MARVVFPVKALMPVQVLLLARRVDEAVESVPQVTWPEELVSRVSQAPVAKKRLVVEAVVAKKLVVVAEVEVELIAVKFCRVVEPVSNRLERVVRPPVAVIVPVKLDALDIVCPLIGPAVRVPMLPVVEKRFVEDAVVLKRDVVVA